MWEAAPQIMNAMTNAFLAKPGEMPKALGMLQSLVSQLPTLDAPRTPFNATITRERSYSARTISAPRRQGDRQGKRRQAQRTW